MAGKTPEPRERMSYYNRYGQTYSRRRCDDEGYYYTYCDACGRQAEHECGSCVECDNRYLEHKRRQAAKEAK